METKSAPPSRARRETRDRLIKLRAEVDVLQAEHDAARAQFIHAVELESAAKFAVFDTFAAGAMELAGKKDTDVKEIIESIRSTPLRGLAGVDNAALSKAVRALADGEKGAAGNVARALSACQSPVSGLVELEKSQLAKIATELVGKKLDLEDVERLYQTEAR
jgi:hypothetical protein